MTERIHSLRERYSALSDDEFQSIAIDGGLTDDARELLDQELRRRGIWSQQETPYEPPNRGNNPDQWK